MIGKIASHQPPGKTGGAEHHDIQLTVSAHQFMLKTPAQTVVAPQRQRRA
jgi:hypothetical protein